MSDSTAERLSKWTLAILAIIATLLVAITAGAVMLHSDVRELKTEMRHTNENQRMAAAAQQEMARDIKEMNRNSARIDVLETRLQSHEHWRDQIDRMIQGGANRNRGQQQ